MKRRIIAMALSIALGVSVFRGSAQAAVAQVASDCSHQVLVRDEKTRVEVGYDQDVSGLFHNIIYKVTYNCANCSSYKVDVLEYEWEYHVYDRYENGYWYCSICGRRDD